MKDLKELRAELDGLDREIVALLEKRMEIACGVAAYKLAHQLPVLDSSREAQVIASRQAMLQDRSYDDHIAGIFNAIMAMSRAGQERYLQAHREEKTDA